MVNIVCFGEVLWDLFPTHKKIGGAPLNVALRLRSLENNVAMISRVGTDPNGKALIDFVEKQGVDIQHIQVDEKLKTGTVQVSIHPGGIATYDIQHPRAWDAIQLTKQVVDKVRAADAFIFGSLITRNDSSRKTLHALLELATYKIFDANLRAPHYTPAALTPLMDAADFIKFNDDEILEIATFLNLEVASLEENILHIAKQTQTQTICVTKGSQGAILFDQETFYYNKGYQVEVMDTVGAGDSFLASLINKLLKGTPPQNALDFACAVGALVAGSEGANPQIHEKDIQKLIKG